MDVNYITEITNKLKSDLDSYRYIHTLGVAGTAASLAMCYGYDTDKAELAGLLHDCAKCIPDEEKLALCAENNIHLSESELKNHKLIHAKLGPFIAESKYGVEDTEILDAIRTHTTGSPAMTLLQKIIFTADYIEPNRDDDIPNISEIRKLAFTDLDKCVYVILKNTLDYLEEISADIDGTTRESYDYYRKLTDN